MNILPHLPLFWLGVLSGIIILALWQSLIKGRLYCFYLFCGHGWQVLIEEIRRPIRVIREALSRKTFNDKFPGQQKDAEDIF